MKCVLTMRYAICEFFVCSLIGSLFVFIFHFTQTDKNFLMDLTLQAFLIAVSFTSASGTLSAEPEGCQSPQYIQIGGTGVIYCTFRQDFYGVLWYDSSETNLEVPFLQLIESEKSGYGYNSGKYDVFQNGSLIIKNVSSVHEQTFTVLKFASSDGDPVSFLVDVITTGTLSAEPEGCQSPQYIQIGGTGVIYCTFRQDFYGVLWYDSSETNLEVPFLQLIESEKSGYGYNSGKYDVFQNGSLIIKNVSSVHEQTFTVLKFASSDGDPVSFLVDVITTVKSKQDRPFIDVCGSDRGPCFARLDITPVINCFIRGVRPAVNLMWFARTSEGDRNISFATNVTRDGITYTSNAVISNFFPTKSPLCLLVCKADSPPGILRENEMFILVENGNISAKENPTEVSIKRGHELKLVCSESKVDMIVWKKLDDPLEILFSAVLFKENISQVYSDEYELHSDGSLIVSHAEVKHEGIYACSFGNGIFAGKQHFYVVVYVPSYPEISGCTPHHYCALNVLPEGNLNCSVTGVRPVVQLEWNVPTERISSEITFSDPEVEVIRNGDVFDIYMSAKYRIRQLTTNRSTVECAISETKIKALESRRRVDLTFITDQGSNRRKRGAKLLFLWVPSSILFVAVCVVLTITFARKRSQRRQMEEMEPWLSVKYKPSAMERPRKHPPLADPKLRTLTEELEAMYGIKYGLVQPTTKNLCVNSIFVDCGYKLMASTSNEREINSWENVKTYKEVLQKIDIPSMVIIEGGPGSGKSMLALQLAYDWCNGIESSPIHDKDILILLRLRDVEGVESVYEAIKEQILPRDSSLSENDVRHLLLECNSGVIILDGLDEYPDLSTDNKSDIMSIVRGEMFQRYLVLITTRSLFLLEPLSPKTRRIKLTGFDEETRHEYIRKVVAKCNRQKEDKIKQCLHNVLTIDLVKSPLFLTYIARTSVKDRGLKNFRSLSSTVKFIITCLHTHMERKMKKEDRKTVKSYKQKHKELDDIAFQIVSGRHKPYWKKTTICEQVGEEFYDYYKRVGILVENVNYNYTSSQPKIKVQFVHELLCEWYAAHCLLRKFEESELGLQHIQENMQLFKLKTVFLLACGISADFAEKTAKYFEKNKFHANFASLCYMESARRIDKISNAVNKILSSKVILDINQDKLLTWSTIQLLMIASGNDMTIASLQLKAYKSQVEYSNGALHLQANICLPYLTTLEQLEIHEFVDMQIRDETSILKYSSMCEKIKTIKFCHCNVARTIQDACLTSLKARNVSVVWETTSMFYMNLQNGLWEREGTPLTEEEYFKEIENTRQGTKSLEVL
ncbi:NLR family CARD domain-containing protein 4 [Holothuria leucospilota]|uniref:NLR family CARD domain-containing protein 4 n=1 Tax=Holothuria leucospilota TaxID=206669 RepID=A0A9Q0YEH0_HOLLE|nr:NLR family CARD domain-containing protein 4 [Holothuria leucospilota]